MSETTQQTKEQQILETANEVQATSVDGMSVTRRSISDAIALDEHVRKSGASQTPWRACCHPVIITGRKSR